MAKRLALLLLLVTSAFGQDAHKSGQPATMLVGGQASATLSQPFNAEWKITKTQTLADGNTIISESRERWARDSEGRTVSIATNPSSAMGMPPTVSYRVMDPVARAYIQWNDSRARVQIARWPAELRCSKIPTSSSSASAHRPLRKSPPSSTSEETEDLGMDSILGLQVHGLRTTTHIPPGTVGNSGTLVSVQEEWKLAENALSSPPFGSTVRSKYSDPRYGLVTKELVSFSQTEPDPSLFRPPTGYEVNDPEPQPSQCPSGWVPETEQ